MALTRSMLKGMGLEDQQVSAIVEAHAETVEGLKAEITKFKEKAEGYDALKKENEELKNNKDTEDWKAKFEKEHSDFEAFKKEQSDKDARSAKKEAYKELLKEAGVSDKRYDAILKVTNLDDLSIDKEGKIKDAEKVVESIKAEWSDFIVTTDTKGAKTPTPSHNEGGTAKTKEEIMNIKDISERQKAIAENPSLFGIQ